MVPESERAWHAGQSSWKGETDINSGSIGIEIVNGGPLLGFPDFPDPQIDAVIDLCKGIISRHGIRPESVLAHSDIAPARKIDPGEKFPWPVLYDAGIGHWVSPSPVRGGRFFSRWRSGAAGRGPSVNVGALWLWCSYRWCVWNVDTNWAFWRSSATFALKKSMESRTCQPSKPCIGYFLHYQR